MSAASLGWVGVRNRLSSPQFNLFSLVVHDFQPLPPTKTTSKQTKKKHFIKSYQNTVSGDIVQHCTCIYRLLSYLKKGWNKFDKYIFKLRNLFFTMFKLSGQCAPCLPPPSTLKWYNNVGLFTSHLAILFIIKMIIRFQDIFFTCLWLIPKIHFFLTFFSFFASFAQKNAFGDENISFFSFGTFLTLYQTLYQIKILRNWVQNVYVIEYC